MRFIPLALAISMGAAPGAALADAPSDVCAMIARVDTAHSAATQARDEALETLQDPEVYNAALRLLDAHEAQIAMLEEASAELERLRAALGADCD